jgi:hypothetical protein
MAPVEVHNGRTLSVLLEREEARLSSTGGYGPNTPEAGSQCRGTAELERFRRSGRGDAKQTADDLSGAHCAGATTPRGVAGPFMISNGGHWGEGTIVPTFPLPIPLTLVPSFLLLCSGKCRRDSIEHETTSNTTRCSSAKSRSNVGRTSPRRTVMCMTNPLRITVTPVALVLRFT